MKKIILGVMATLLLLSFVSCATKAHWAGVYTGVVPSAGGEGIDTRVTLNVKETYKIEEKYLGKSNEVFTSSGKFTWNPERNIVIIPADREGYPPRYYKLGEKALIHLDIEGDIITGDLANDYILYKQK